MSARIGDQENTARRTLVTVGAIVLLPCVGVVIALGIDEGYSHPHDGSARLTFAMALLGWTVAVAAPLLLSWLLRGRAAQINVLWALWAYALILAAGYEHSYDGNFYHRHLLSTLVLYALCAVGSVGLLAWGLYEKRKERVNLGFAAFALSVLFFYFDRFMDKLGRSASLLTLGILASQVATRWKLRDANSWRAWRPASERHAQRIAAGSPADRTCPQSRRQVAL